MKVGIDLDGVVFDWVGAVTREYENWFGFPLAGQIKEWDDPLKLSHFESYTDLFDWCDRANVWGACAYVPGARGGIEHLLAEGHQISFVTSRHGGGADWAKMWVDSQFGPRNMRVGFYPNLGVAKYTVPCSVYIEDSPAAIQELQGAGKDVLIFDQPWNAKVKGDRVKSWIDAVEAISGR